MAVTLEVEDVDHFDLRPAAQAHSSQLPIPKRSVLRAVAAM